MKVQEEQSAIEMFGVPIYLINGTIRLRDIQAAYLAETGANERATNPDNWLRSESVKGLIEFLDTDFYPLESEGIKSLDTPRGRRGGLYACRELAHNYATWLDVRYGAYVLKAFDQLVSGDLFGAKRTANKVSKRFNEESYEARFERLTRLGVDYKVYMSEVLVGLLGYSPNVDYSDFLGILITTCPTSSSFLNDILCGLEVASLREGDLTVAIEDALDIYAEDPRMPVFQTFISNYKEDI